MKKILLLLPASSSFKKPFISSFRKLNWQVKTFDYRKGNLPIRIFRFVPYFGGHVKALKKINNEIIKINNQFKPEIILTVKGELLGKDLISKIKHRNNKIVNWFPDPMNLWYSMVEIAPYYDYFLHFDPMVVNKLKRLSFKNIYYLPFASDIQTNNNKLKIYDLSFIGTYSTHREKILSKLKKFNINIWGDSKWLYSSLKKFARGGRISQGKMKDIIQKSKINLNIHYNAPKEGANLRTFEVTGSGGFLLTDYVVDLNELFRINKEIICYRSFKDLQKKIRFFLSNEKQRERIANEGYNKAKSSHNYLIRVNKLLELLNNNQNLKPN